MIDTGISGTTGREGMGYQPHPKPEHSEGPIARAIEQQTAKLPSDVFLWTAIGAIAGSLLLQTLGKKEVSNFVGQWVPTILIFGLYNKLVKVAGSH